MDTGLDYFDRMYEQPDPWGYETSDYEARKYAVTLASLPRARYRRTFEPGCSIGVLTRLLAQRTEELLAVERHPVPLERARERLADRPQVEVRQMRVPDQWPEGTFDLVVISELAYYFDDRRLELLVSNTSGSLAVGGDLVVVHWTGPTDYPQTGRAVQDRLRRAAGLAHLVAHRDESFELDVLRRVDGIATNGPG